MNISFTGQEHVKLLNDMLYHNPMKSPYCAERGMFEGITLKDLDSDQLKIGVQNAKNKNKNKPGFDVIIDKTIEFLKSTLKKA